MWEQCGAISRAQTATRRGFFGSQPKQLVRDGKTARLGKRAVVDAGPKPTGPALIGPSLLSLLSRSGRRSRLTASGRRSLPCGRRGRSRSRWSGRRCRSGRRGRRIRHGRCRSGRWRRRCGRARFGRRSGRCGRRGALTAHRIGDKRDNDHRAQYQPNGVRAALDRRRINGCIRNVIAAARIDLRLGAWRLTRIGMVSHGKDSSEPTDKDPTTYAEGGSATFSPLAVFRQPRSSACDRSRSDGA